MNTITLSVKIEINKKLNDSSMEELEQKLTEIIEEHPELEWLLINFVAVETEDYTEDTETK